MRFVLTILFTWMAAQSFAQVPEAADRSMVLTGTIHPLKTIVEQKPIPLTNFNGANVEWSKRVWRKIDLREKINHIYYYPLQKSSERESLIQALMRGVLEEEMIDAYEDDGFKIPKSKQQILAELSRTDTNYVDDPDKPGQVKPVVYKNEFNTASIKQYFVKEDWYYDKDRQQLHVRIKAIAPVQEVLESNGTLKGYKILFWVYYPQARYTLASTEAFNRHNDAARLSFDDMFIKRFFSSYIYKELDLDEKMLNEFEEGIEALVESEKIKEEILSYERSLWEF